LDRDSYRQSNGDFDADSRLESQRDCRGDGQYDFCDHRQAGVEGDLQGDSNRDPQRHSNGNSDRVFGRGSRRDSQRDSLTDFGGGLE